MRHELAVAVFGALAAVALAGCPTHPRDQGTPAPTPIGPDQARSPGTFKFPGHEGRPYDVVPGESLLTILAFRGGALAKVGHNHVIASHDVTGTFYVPENPLQTTFELHVPVAQLTIDEPQLRSQEGPEFPPDVPQSAKEGTRHNMLSDALLDVANFPEIMLTERRLGAAATNGGDAAAQVCPARDAATLDPATRDRAAPDHATPDRGPPDRATPDHATSDRGSPDHASANGATRDHGPDHATLDRVAQDPAGQGCAVQAELQVTIRGQTHALSVPVVYSLQRSQLEASGELAMKQTDLGLTPFNAMLGALQVQDELHVRFKLVARLNAEGAIPKRSVKRREK